MIGYTLLQAGVIPAAEARHAGACLHLGVGASRTPPLALVGAGALRLPAVAVLVRLVRRRATVQRPCGESSGAVGDRRPLLSRLQLLSVAGRAASGADLRGHLRF